jgi:hypothetical protein
MAWMLTPEQAFEYRWALTLLDEVVRQLGTEFQGRGQAALFKALKPCLVGDGSAQPYAQLASTLGMEKGAIKVAVHRLRRRYPELLRAEIADTVAAPVIPTWLVYTNSEWCLVSTIS